MSFVGWYRDCWPTCSRRTRGDWSVLWVWSRIDCRQNMLKKNISGQICFLVNSHFWLRRSTSLMSTLGCYITRPHIGIHVSLVFEALQAVCCSWLSLQTTVLHLFVPKVTIVYSMPCRLQRAQMLQVILSSEKIE